MIYWKIGPKLLNLMRIGRERSDMTVPRLRADVVIRRCTLLTMSDRGVIRQGLMAIKDGSIIYVGREVKAPSFEADKIIDGSGKIAMPGLINCHTHAAMSLFRSIAEDKELSVWLREVIWPLESKLKPEDVYYGTLLSCVEMIKSGTTCFSDMYFHEDMVAKAVIAVSYTHLTLPTILLV